MSKTNRDGDGSNLDKFRKWERTKKLQDLWKQALYRKFKGMAKESTNCDDRGLGEWGLCVTFRDK